MPVMMLSTPFGDYPIPASVAARLPSTPTMPTPDAGERDPDVIAFRDWMEASPENAIAFERLRRWHRVQEDLAAEAKAQNRPFVVTEDGLD